VKNKIISLHYNSIIKKIEKRFIQNSFKNETEKKEFNTLYLRTLRNIEIK